MIYFITNRKLVEPEKFLPIIQEATSAGVRAVILREKDLAYQELLNLALNIQTLCSAAGVFLIINGNEQVAREIQADGIQVSFQAFRDKKAGFSGIVGVSVHSLEEALLAEEDGADYVLASHIFPTDCKKGLPPKGIDWLQEIVASINIPVIGLGGINLNNIGSVFEIQADGAALMSEIMCAKDVGGFIKKLKDRIA